MSAAATPLLHDAVAELATRHPSGRRVLDPTAPRPFHLTARNEFLTPRGLVYKWQDVAAELDRGVLGTAAPTIAPVRFTWRGLRSRTGSPKETGPEREWTFVRGQCFDALLMHTELTAPVPPAAPQPDLGTDFVMIGYPGLPKSPAVDLLVLISWDAVTFELLCTQLVGSPGLREAGAQAELDRISGTEAQFAFSDPAAVARFRNARATAEHLGYGSVAGRPTAVYATRCLDCRLDVRSGPLTQRGRSSYWVTLHLDLETRDLLSAQLTEIIVAVLTGEDGREVPVHKRRSVRMWVPAPGESRPALGAATATPRPHGSTSRNTAAQNQAKQDPVTADPDRAEAPAAPDPANQADPAHPAELGEAVRLAGLVCDHVGWQVGWLDHLPESVAELTLKGFRSLVGSDLPDAHTHVNALRTELRAAAAAGGPLSAALRAALPEHRRWLEGLLAFGQLAVGGTERFGDIADEATRASIHDRIGSLRADLAGLLAVLARLEAPGRTPVPADHDPEGES
ncbi:MAG TPA: hypothetical protein VFU73_10885 [Actinocrinis sp.]|nr:hypothetical protein [Actinocrinis sp.]